VVPGPDTPQWKLPTAEVERLTEHAKAVFGDPAKFTVKSEPLGFDDQPDFHSRHAWTADGFEDLPAEKQRAIAPPRPLWQPGNDENAEAVRPQTAMQKHIPGADHLDDAVPVRRARPQTAGPAPRKDAHAVAKWKAQNDFTYYTPSEDPKEIGAISPHSNDFNVILTLFERQPTLFSRIFHAFFTLIHAVFIGMHQEFQARQNERLKKHQREVEMRSALTGWAVRRARIDEEIVRRQEAVQWSVRAHSAAPRVRILDVNAPEEEDDAGILSDESDTEFADGVLSMADANKMGRAESAASSRGGAGESPGGKKQRPQSRGATWLSSYHEKSFHRIEYEKPKVSKKRPQSHRPMYVQRPETPATDVGGRPGSAYLHKELREVGGGGGEEEEEEEEERVSLGERRQPRVISATSSVDVPRSLSSLPTKPRTMSATRYRKELQQANEDAGGKRDDLSQPEDKPPLLVTLKPPPDKEWEKDQMDFRRYQVKEVQGVREAFMRQGQRVSMATIERALRVPNERTFAECMSGLTSAGYMLRSDPEAKKKKKGKKKKKK